MKRLFHLPPTRSHRNRVQNNSLAVRKQNSSQNLRNSISLSGKLKKSDADRKELKISERFSSRFQSESLSSFTNFFNLFPPASFLGPELYVLSSGILEHLNLKMKSGAALKELK